MDGQRFDELTRLIGSGATRRRMLKLFGGGAAVAAGLGRLSEARAGFCTGAGDSCGFDDVCCSQSCVDEICQCSGTGSACIDDGDCCVDNVCDGGLCVATCASAGEACVSTDDCCANNECIDDICSFCRVEGIVCEDDSDCCQGLFCDGDSGLCAYPCGGEFDRCETSDDCCAGYACVNGGKGSFCFPIPPECEIDGDCDPCEACVEGTCEWQCTSCEGCNPDAGDNGTCYFTCDLGEGDACCDAGEVCNQETGVCEVEAPTCAAEGESCGIFQGDNEIECCEDLACSSDGVCEAIEMPECETDDDCVVGAAGDIDAAICCAGVCRQIECCIDDVLSGGNPNDRCDEGEICFEGQCVFVCKGDADCAHDTCCCPDGTCSTSCCDGYVPPKDDETGGVTTLPSTGSGDGDGGLSGLLGAGLVAGAAAYLGAKKLKESEGA